MAHPGFPVRLDPSWTYYLNVVAAYVVRDDGAGGQEFADIVNDEAFDLSGTDFSIVDDPTHGYILRSTGDGGTHAEITSPTDYWSSLDAISVIYWSQKDTFTDTSPYWMRWNSAFGEMPWRIVDFGSGDDGLECAVATDTTTATADNYTVSGSSSTAIAIGVTWGSSSGVVQSHLDTNHGSGSSLSGNTVRSNAGALQLEDHHHDTYAILVLDVELTDAQWDSVAGEDPFAAFTQSAYSPSVGEIRLLGFAPDVDTESVSEPITATTSVGEARAEGQQATFYVPPPDGYSTITIQYDFDPDEDNILDAAGGTDNSANLENGADELRWGDVNGCVNLSVNADGTYTCDSGGTFSYEVWDASAFQIIQSGTVQVIELLDAAAGQINLDGPMPLFVPGQEVSVPTGIASFTGRHVSLADAVTVTAKVGRIRFVPLDPQRLVTDADAALGQVVFNAGATPTVFVITGWVPIGGETNSWSAIAAASGVQIEL